MMPRIFLGAMIVMSLLVVTGPAEAVYMHNFSCKDCHKPDVTVTGLGVTKTNLCLQCHTNPPLATTFFDARGTKSASGKFLTDEASTAASAPTPDGTSHHWAAGDNNNAAGATAPASSFYYSRYGISRTKVTCGRCHDPHQDVASAQQLRSTTKFEICSECHASWTINNQYAVLTHPVGIDYPPSPVDPRYTAPDPRLRVTVDPTVGSTVSGADVQLVAGKIGCSTCHRSHFSDSNNLTTDGTAGNYGSDLNYPGDGYMLRGDGPGTTGANGIETAKRRSSLCQSCHVFATHGKTSAINPLGCLDCHSAHAYNNSNIFVLRPEISAYIPRLGSNGTVTLPPYTGLYNSSTNKVWSDLAAGQANGYCERCHGDTESPPISQYSSGHNPSTAPANGCVNCHHHDGAYSWEPITTASGCSDCHGFPPYLNAPGDLDAPGGQTGGYAYISSTNNYATSGTNLNESTTPHNTHAGGGSDLGNSPDTDYKLAGVSNPAASPCDACHLGRPEHNKGGTGTYQSIDFSALATYNGLLSPAYNTGSYSCSNLYCHSNGGRRNSTGTKAVGDFKFAASNPGWSGTDGTIVGSGSRCSFCHGNSAANMDNQQQTDRYNSTSHLNHLGAGPLAKTYSCAACHKDTASSDTALAAGAHIAPSGKHVNGAVDVVFNTSYSLGNGLLTASPYNGGTLGTCIVYCHSNGKGSTVQTPDWDDATTGQCGDCHSVSAVGTGLSDPHSKHLAITGPAGAVTCVDCHGTGATAGTHSGHVDGAFTIEANACDGCHGYEAGETMPAWSQPLNNDYCLTCHAGGIVGSVKGMGAPSKQHAKTRGHNATASYASGNLPGSKLCTDCHLSSIGNHVNASLGDASHLQVAATTCTTACHGVGGSATKNGIVTHMPTQSTVCTACHDPHGDTAQANIFMIRSKSPAAVVSPRFASDTVPVVFTQRGNDSNPAGATDSYDEIDSGATANYDDICATCHTRSHNNKSDTGTHVDGLTHEGENCFTCHLTHTETTGAFAVGGGNACNGCHGNPPATGAHRELVGGRDLEDDLTNRPLHSMTGSHDKELEDRTDCAKCHPGADQYTYSPTEDRSPTSGLNHGDKAGRRTLMSNSAVVGYQRDPGTNRWFCSNACHVSSPSDGFWYTWDGSNEDVTAANRTPVDTVLDCSACHYYEATITSSANNVAAGTRALTLRHDSHFDRQKGCASCHNVVTPFAESHITTPDSGTHAAKIESRAKAAQDEAEVLPATLGTGSDPDPGQPTCAGPGLGCHNTKITPAWNSAPGSIPCTNCHEVTGSATADPKSGLHNISAAGVQKHDSSLPGGCTACHNGTKPATHADGAWEDDSATNQTGGQSRFLNRSGLVYTEGAVNRSTCFDNGTTALDAATCHSDGGVWKRRWSQEANSTATASGSARCNVCHGQYSSLPGSNDTGWNEGSSHYQTYGGALSVRGETHRSLGGDNNACEDCHSYTTLTANHKNGQITMNDDAAEIIVTELGGHVWCDKCHDDGDPLLDNTYTFTQSIFPLQTVAGANDPKQECNSCHGIGGNGRYWPVGTAAVANNTSKNDAGRHEIHMARLAQSIYFPAATSAAEAVNLLLADVDTKNKQIALCQYCHPGTPGQNPGHTDTSLPAEVANPAGGTYMYTLWDATRSAPDDATYTGTGLDGTGTCANVNCHQNKDTNNATLSGFKWYPGAYPLVAGTSTQNCSLCHIDVTANATHLAHTNAGATYGRNVACGECHAGSPAWSPYTVPATAHVNGSFAVTGGASGITYSGGTCGTNVCHNNGKDGQPYNNGGASYTWGSTTFTGCTACHRTDVNLGSSHDPHMNGTFAATFGRSAVGCEECHDAGASLNMASKAGHFDGNVTLKAGVNYTGNVSVTTANSYGTCANACHQDGKGGSSPSPLWNRVVSSTDNCTICHSNGAGQPNPATGRHDKHVANTAYVISNCGSCHANANATATAIGGTSHINGAANTGASISVHTAGSAGCTNTCHLVDTSRGDWLDTDVLACRDCHSGTKIGGDNTATSGPNYLPQTGLHAITPRVSGKRHDETLKLAAACEACHTGIRAAASTHIKGTWVANSTSNTDRGLFGSYADASGSCFGSGVDLAAGCHRDDGKWGRKWSATAVNSDGSECANCHGGVGAGYATGAWVSGVVPDHAADWDTDGTPGEVLTKHSVCKTCHGFAGAANKDDAYDLTNLWNQGGADTSMHGNSQITLNGTAQYNQSNYGCDNAGCHGGAAGTNNHALADSGWSTVELVSFSASGSACDSCHGGAGVFWPNGPDITAGNRAGAHAQHVLAIAKKKNGTSTPTVTQQNATCDYCHPGNTHNADTNLPADVSMTDTDNSGSADAETGTKMKKIVGGVVDDGGFWRRTPGTCSNVNCHAAAPFTPHWYADTVAPGNVTLTPSAGPEPNSIKLSWTAPGNDDAFDGTAYKYDIRMGSDTDTRYPAAAEATNFSRTDNHVGDVPTVKRKGELQEAIIRNLIPGHSYSFALRTYDENVISDPNTTVFGTSNPVNFTVPADLTPPVLVGSPAWYGVDSVAALDIPGTALLRWTRAEDHSMPITYNIFYSQGSVSYATPQASTKAVSYRLTGLELNKTYEVAVKAKDRYNNVDTNTNTLKVVPQGYAAVPKTGVTYYASGTATTNIPMQTAPGTDGSTSTIPAVFIGPTTFTKDTNIFANGFSLNVVNGNGGTTTLSAELGYITGASTFNKFSAPASGQADVIASPITVAKRANRVITFKFAGAQRLMKSTMSGKLGVRISVSGTNNLSSIGWGPTSKGGILTFTSQPVNASPSATAPTVNATVAGSDLQIYWTAFNDATDGVNDTVHYDVFASADNGSDGFPFVVKTGLTAAATLGAPLVWNTQEAGIGIVQGQPANVQIRVEVGDTINGKALSHTAITSGTIVVDNSSDKYPPGTIKNFKAETRPKQGSVYLSWTAPGDDNGDNGRASYYDIRYSENVIDSDTKFDAAPQLVAEPYPLFGGENQGFEVLGLADGNYFFAIKAYDDGVPPKASPLAYTLATEPAAAGPKCGICHSTPPDEGATKGNHAKHGYTMRECANCHGNDPVLGAQNFTTDHQDGKIKLGWKTADPVEGVLDDASGSVSYTQNGHIIYSDPGATGTSGVGGFNQTSGGAEPVDNGSCGNWSNQQISGCHGPAADVSWDADAVLPCAACHGDNARVLDDYGHSYDDPSVKVKAAPPVDNHGYDGTDGAGNDSPNEWERKYVGAHTKHLNYSFRLSKGDACRMCHVGNNHADGAIDVKLDLSATGIDATWTRDVDPNKAGTCGSMDPNSCHPTTGPQPKWDSAVTFACINCHGFNGTIPAHVTDPIKGVTDPNGVNAAIPVAEQMPGNCTWCHIGGHPREKDIVSLTKAAPAVVTTANNHNLISGEKVTIHVSVGMVQINNRTFNVTVLSPTTFSLDGSNTTGYTDFTQGTWIEGNGWGTILVPNDTRVGINYKSGGIHMKANVGARGEMQSEAELCWGCHVQNGISEWDADDAPANTATKDATVGNGNYNFGRLTATPNGPGNWIGATWTSGTAIFGYKTQTIRSTHSTDANGTTALTGGPYAYTNGGVDPVNLIRCSNCHDVHNTNMSPKAADGLDPSGPPYLRGTWMSNPYKEDGAPQAGQTYTAHTYYGAVPRASNSTTNAMGGYWIDQNSGNPTASWTYNSSAALCQLCHGETVDGLDYASGENLWITTTNGHKNAVLGGSATGGANIFFNGAGGRAGTGGRGVNPNYGGWMGFENSLADTGKGYVYGPRSSRGGYLPPFVNGDVTVANLGTAWGVMIDATTTEGGYHAFSCSKCHNPHASRLPKLMITNCLDISKNTFDNNYSSDPDWAAQGFNRAESSWGTQKLSHLSTAQNCHRFIDVNGDNTPDEKGWNKVTPW